MGITFRHDVAAGITGAAAAGQAAARNRRQKYAMASLLQNQRDRNRLAAIGAGRARAAGGRAAAAPDGMVIDPLDTVDLTGIPEDEHAQARVRNNAARRARARKERMGLDVPSSSRRRFIPQDQIDRQRELEDLQRKEDREDFIRGEERGFDVEDAERKRQEAIDDQIFEAEQTARQEQRSFARSQLEEGGYSNEQKAQANKVLREIALLQANKKLGPQDEAARQQKIAELDDELTSILDDPQGVPELTLDQQAKKRFWTNPQTGQTFQWIEDEKRFEPVKSDDSAQAAQKAQDDWIIKKYNEYRAEMAGEDYEGDLKNEDDAFAKAQKDWMHEQRRRAELKAARQGPEAQQPDPFADDVQIPQPVTGEAAQEQMDAGLETGPMVDAKRETPAQGFAATANRRQQARDLREAAMPIPPPPPPTPEAIAAAPAYDPGAALLHGQVVKKKGKVFQYNASTDQFTLVTKDEIPKKTMGQRAVSVPKNRGFGSAGVMGGF